MITPREGCGIGVLDNEIFVIGGWNKFTTKGDQGVKIVEAFCPFKEKWRTCGSLNEIRHWVAVSNQISFIIISIESLLTNQYVQTFFN